MNALIQKIGVVAAFALAVAGAWFLLLNMTGASVWWLKLVLFLCAFLAVLIVIILSALFFIVVSAMCKRGCRRMQGRPLP